MRASCRVSLFVALLAASACASAVERIYRSSFENPVDCVATPTNPECPTFTIATPPITVAPGVANSTCYYFRSPNTAVRGIRHIESTMTGDAWYIVVFATYTSGTNTPADRQPPGTLSDQACGAEATTNNTDAYRIYQAHANAQALDMPTDDGTGTPVAIELKADQPLFVQVVAPNPTANPIQAQATIGFDALPVGQAYTRTETFQTYNTQITIPPSSGATATATCAVPGGVKYWHFTTHTHQRAQSATLSSFNSLQTLVVTTNPASPNIQEFLTPPHFSFGAGQQLRYSCTYFNPDGFTVLAGADEFNDENCLAIAYFFPATRPRLCINNILVP